MSSIILTTEKASVWIAPDKIVAWFTSQDYITRAFTTVRLADDRVIHVKECPMDIGRLKALASAGGVLFGFHIRHADLDNPAADRPIWCYNNDTKLGFTNMRYG